MDRVRDERNKQSRSTDGTTLTWSSKESTVQICPGFSSKRGDLAN